MRTRTKPHFREHRADRTRRRILDASLRLFSNFGYDRASMDDIALELEATKGLLYHYFRSKHEILAAILKEHPFRAAIDDFAQGVPARDLREALAIATALGLDMMREHRTFVRFLILQAQSSTEQAEVVQDIINRWAAAYQATIEAHVSPGRRSIAPLCARQLVDLILASFIRNEFAPQPQDDLDAYAQEAVETVLSRINSKT